MLRIWFLLGAVWCAGVAAMAQTFDLQSPDGRQTFRMEISNDAGQTRIRYSTAFDGQPVICPSEMDLQIDNRTWEQALGKNFPCGERWCGNLHLLETTRTSRDSVWLNPYGERSVVEERYNGMILHFGKNDGSEYRLDIEVRAYDAGIAFRYLFPMHPTAIYHRIKADNTEFSFPEGSRAWVTAWAQGPYELRPFRDWEDEAERPLTVKISEQLHAAIAEAGVVDFPRGKFKLARNRENTVVMALNDDGTDIVTPYRMPWRVVMAARSAGELLENNDIFLNLNEPSQIPDERWIKPGKIMRETTLTTENALQVIDFCQAHGMNYILFDWLWYGPAFDFASDATKVVAPIDMPRVIEYGRQKGVGVWLYVNQHALQKQGEELFRTFERWGVVGVKFGFVQFCNQHWADWLHHLVRLAAKHHLMVNIHDEYRPTGYSRTFPNLLTQEGIRGNEEFPSATHNTILPFTRMLCGAGDYTVCYFDKRLKNTHAHQLALPVIFFSPLQTLYWYDRPSGTEKVPELEFFDTVPVVWDETRVLDDAIGQHVAIARRSGDEWFVGVIAADDPCRLRIDTDFLEQGRKYLLKAYTDDDLVQTPTRVKVSTAIVSRGDRLNFRLKARGGAALHLRPAEPKELEKYGKSDRNHYF